MEISCLCNVSTHSLTQVCLVSVLSCSTGLRSSDSKLGAESHVMIGNKQNKLSIKPHCPIPTHFDIIIINNLAVL